MASNKVTLRTAFEGDTFVVGDTTVTAEGTEFPSRAKADEVLAAAKNAGIRLFEVPAEAVAEAKNEGSGS